MVFYQKLYFVYRVHFLSALETGIKRGSQSLEILKAEGFKALSAEQLANIKEIQRLDVYYVASDSE